MTFEVKSEYRDVLFDVDGTITNPSHRQHHLYKKPKNWKKFNEEIPHDTPHNDIIYILNLLHHTGHNILVCSARSEEERKMTVDWMIKHDIWHKITKMYMRKAKDYRDDSIVKKELLEEIRKDGYNPHLVFDDRDRVVVTWRELGIRCLQVAEGDF